MKANGWINVKDRLPKIGERVLVCQTFNDGEQFIRIATRVKVNQRDMWFEDDGFELAEYITHWKKLIYPKADLK